MGPIVNRLFLLFITCLWASSFAAIQEITQVMPTFAFLFWRFFLSFLCLLPWIVWVIYKNRDDKPLLRKRLAPFYSLGLAFLTGFGIILQTLGTTMTSTSRAAFISTFFIVLIPIFSYFLPKFVPKKWLNNFYVPKFTKMLLSGLCLSVTGLILIMAPWAQMDFDGGHSSSLLGDGLVMLCTFGLAGQIILIQLLPKCVDAVCVTGLQFLFASLFCLIGVWVSGETLLGHFHWPALIYIVLFVTVLTLVIQILVQPLVNTVEVAAIYSLEPLFATVLGWIYLSERPSALAWVGGSFLIFGVLFIEVVPSLLKRKTICSQKVNVSS